MITKRIYAVKILLPEPKVRLVRAANINAALRHVASHLLYAEVATQDTLVSLTMCGVKVEEAETEQRKEITPAPNEDSGLEAQAPPEGLTPITELPAHMDRRQKAGVG